MGQRKSTKPVRTLTRGGCLTCRKRKVKCDAATPACSPCQRLDIQCVRQKQQARLLWMPPIQGDIYKADGENESESAKANEPGNRRSSLFSGEQHVVQLLIGIIFVSYVLAEHGALPFWVPRSSFILVRLCYHSRSAHTNLSRA